MRHEAGGATLIPRLPPGPTIACRRRWEAARKAAGGRSPDRATQRGRPPLPAHGRAGWLRADSRRNIVLLALKVGWRYADQRGMSTRIPRLSIAAVGVTLTMLLAGCGSSSGSPNAPQPSHVTA